MEDLSRQLLLESDQYAEAMLWNNQNGQADFDDSCSDISSGYESIGRASDLFSNTSGESANSCQQPIRNETKPEVMKFNSVQPLCDNLKLILSMPELCDVTFLVGPGQTAVHGVKAIMGTRSRKLYELIIKHSNLEISEAKNTKKGSRKKEIGLSRSLSDRLVIPVKKYDAEVFRNLIQFVHCGSVSVTEDTVVGLYCGACQFGLPDLEKACLVYVERLVQSGSHETNEALLRSTRSYSHHKASKTLFDQIYPVLDRRYNTTFGEVSL